MRFRLVRRPGANDLDEMRGTPGHADEQRHHQRAVVAHVFVAGQHLGAPRLDGARHQVVHEQRRSIPRQRHLPVERGALATLDVRFDRAGGNAGAREPALDLLADDADRVRAVAHVEIAPLGEPAGVGGRPRQQFARQEQQQGGGREHTQHQGRACVFGGGSASDHGEDFAH